MRAGIAIVLLAACGKPSPAREPADVDAAGEEDAPAPTDALPSTSRVWSHFNWPRAHASLLDPTITSELVRMIGATPSGELIRGNFYVMQHPRIQAALEAAYDRGVTMRITLDGSPENRALAPAQSVASHLGTSAGFCGSPDPAQSAGCITTAPGGIAHSKFLTFSRTQAPDGVLYPNVVWIGSYNAIDHASGDGDSNNAISIYDSQVAYDQLSLHQTRMQNQTHYPGNDYYDRASGRGYFYDPDARLEAHISPEAGASLVLDQLQRITPDTSCVIRVFQAAIADSMMPTIDQLIELEHGGCRTFVVTTVIEPMAAGALAAAGIEVRLLSAVHDKVFLVDASYDGSAAHRHLVFTGSHNWSTKSTYGNDEILVSLENETHYNLFYAHFLDAWHAAAH